MQVILFILLVTVLFPCYVLAALWYNLEGHPFVKVQYQYKVKFTHASVL